MRVINEQDVFDIIDDLRDRMTVEGYCAMVERVKALPSAQPEQKKGKWIDETFKPWGLVYHPYKCNQCGGYSEADSDFCPDCGAKMEGTE